MLLRSFIRCAILFAIRLIWAPPCDGILLFRSIIYRFHRKGAAAFHASRHFIYVPYGLWVIRFIDFRIGPSGWSVGSEEHTRSYSNRWEKERIYS